MGSDTCATPSAPSDGSRGTAAEIAALLGLQPHREGGFYRETYRSPFTVATASGPRALATIILYLLTATSPSRFHRLRFDEVWLYQAGSPAELFLLGEAREASGNLVERVILGPERPQFVVSGGRWLAARVLQKGVTAPPVDGEASWSLAGCVVSPGFEYEDFELAARDELLRAFPEARELILALT